MKKDKQKDLVRSILPSTRRKSALATERAKRKRRKADKAARAARKRNRRSKRG